MFAFTNKRIMLTYTLAWHPVCLHIPRSASLCKQVKNISVVPNCFPCTKKRITMQKQDISMTPNGSSCTNKRIIMLRANVSANKRITRPARTLVNHIPPRTLIYQPLSLHVPILISLRLPEHKRQPMVLVVPINESKFSNPQ